MNHHSVGNGGFEIFTDTYDVEEIIEEKLIEEDEENLAKSTLESMNESNDSISSTNSEAAGQEPAKDDSVDSSVEEKKATDYIWVQIGAPIRCFSKL